jgi:hypothetical protein
MKFRCTKLVPMERETLKVYVGILRSSVVTLFAARGDMRENGGHRRQESLLREPVSSSNRTAHPHTFTTKSEVSSMTDYQTDGLAVLVLMMMMNFCVGLHVHLT